MEKLRDAGLRITPQRRAVWSAFEAGAGEHLTADEVFGRARDELPELSRATVYNTLSVLVDVGLLRMIESRGAVLYDSDPDPTHHHFRCRSCDRLYDVHVEGVEGLKISGDRKFMVDWKNVLLGGLCPECLPAK
ncbi:MAG TPA: Fur family transcriptional regulator [Rubrobacteraceae bacterium]|nr:Fur family transcriptional regulator [Rubrobacteraceae bacterium]